MCFYASIHGRRNNLFSLRFLFFDCQDDFFNSTPQHLFQLDGLHAYFFPNRVVLHPPFIPLFLKAALKAHPSRTVSPSTAATVWAPDHPNPPRRSSFLHQSWFGAGPGRQSIPPTFRAIFSAPIAGVGRRLEHPISPLTAALRQIERTNERNAAVQWLWNATPHETRQVSWRAHEHTHTVITPNPTKKKKKNTESVQAPNENPSCRTPSYPQPHSWTRWANGWFHLSSDCGFTAKSNVRTNVTPQCSGSGITNTRHNR